MLLTLVRHKTAIPFGNFFRRTPPHGHETLLTTCAARGYSEFRSSSRVAVYSLRHCGASEWPRSGRRPSDSPSPGQRPGDQGPAAPFSAQRANSVPGLRRTVGPLGRNHHQVRPVDQGVALGPEIGGASARQEAGKSSADGPKIISHADCSPLEKHRLLLRKTIRCSHDSSKGDPSDEHEAKQPVDSGVCTRGILLRAGARNRGQGPTVPGVGPGGAVDLRSRQSVSGSVPPGLSRHLLVLEPGMGLVYARQLR